jgi:hypothetical protein
MERGFDGHWHCSDYRPIQDQTHHQEPQVTQVGERTMNITQIQTGIRDLETQIRDLKGQLRSPWTKVMSYEQYDLFKLKFEITQLYIILAYSRGKHHLADPDYCKQVYAHWQKQQEIAA